MLNKKTQNFAEWITAMISVPRVTRNGVRTAIVSSLPQVVLTGIIEHYDKEEPGVLDDGFDENGFLARIDEELYFRYIAKLLFGRDATYATPQPF